MATLEESKARTTHQPMPSGPAVGGRWGAFNSIDLVFLIKGKMEPEMDFQGSPPSPNSILRGWGSYSQAAHASSEAEGHCGQIGFLGSPKRTLLQKA